LPVLEGYLAAGDVRRASELLDRVLGFIAETGEHIVEPEIYRLKGDCSLRSGGGRVDAAGGWLVERSANGRIVRPCRTARLDRPWDQSPTAT